MTNALASFVEERRAFLASSAALACTWPVKAQDEPIFTPEMFGAVGDGHTDDSAAMARLSDAVTRHGGGTVVFRPVTYLVGGPQDRTEERFRFAPAGLLVFTGCRRPLTIRGNGARLQCRPGLRYGVFDGNGRALMHELPYYGEGIATPYVAMVEVAQCIGSVEISDLELAGVADELVVGGPYGDVGWQIPGTGLILRENQGAEIVRRIRTHHHPLDGMIVDGVDAEPTGVSRRIESLIASANGRQGCSIVGGRGYRFASCRFERSGSGRIRSAPGAGVDIEAENGKRIRTLCFTDCRFADNLGPGMVADNGDSEDVRFKDCIFVGGRSWSAWPNRPSFRFDGCTFAGPLTRAYGDPEPRRATAFHDCTFTDDPTISTYGTLYQSASVDHPLADLSDSANILFNRCHFFARHGATLPWSTRAIYHDGVMVQDNDRTGFPRGRFLGTTRIDGKVDLYSSQIVGTVIVNGRRQR